jgi:hypothetical protein
VQSVGYFTTAFPRRKPTPQLVPRPKLHGVASVVASPGAPGDPRIANPAGGAHKYVQPVSNDVALTDATSTSTPVKYVN